MKINYELQPVVLRPIYCLVQVLQLALNIGFTGCNLESPISDRQPDMVETKG